MSHTEEQISSEGLQSTPDPPVDATFDTSVLNMAQTTSGRDTSVPTDDLT